jgi:hypothetical protein
MKARFFFSILLAILFCQTQSVVAQQTPPTRYTMYSYMKVTPGMDDDYLKLEKAWKKLHIARKKAGKMDDWSLTVVLSPAGSGTEYNYVTRNVFLGAAQLAGYYQDAYMPDNWTSLLTPEEIALVNRTGELRTIVKEEVWTATDEVLAEDLRKNAKIAVFNYFDFPATGSHDKHVKNETEVWKPVHAARVKDGTMKGWVLLQMQFPFGANMPYQDATIDLYTDMNQYLATDWFNKYFAKLHPGKDVNQLLQQTTESATLVKGEVRMILDRLDW